MILSLVLAERANASSARVSRRHETGLVGHHHGLHPVAQLELADTRLTWLLTVASLSPSSDAISPPARRRAPAARGLAEPERLG